MDRQFDDFLLPCDREHVIHNFFDDFDSGVLVFIDSMSKPIEQNLFIFDIFDKLGHFVLGPDTLQHNQDQLGVSALLGAR